MEHCVICTGRSPSGNVSRILVKHGMIYIMKNHFQISIMILMSHRLQLLVHLQLTRLMRESKELALEMKLLLRMRLLQRI
jgi:hypothetical protein